MDTMPGLTSHALFPYSGVLPAPQTCPVLSTHTHLPASSSHIALLVLALGLVNCYLFPDLMHMILLQRSSSWLPRLGQALLLKTLKEVSSFPSWHYLQVVLILATR